MTVIKYLKSAKPYSITLATGRSDFQTIKFSDLPNENTILYTDLVVSDPTSINYNEELIQEYIKNNILLEILIDLPYYGPYSITYAISPVLYSTITAPPLA